jgi:hypothetical protein
MQPNILVACVIYPPWVWHVFAFCVACALAACRLTLWLINISFLGLWHVVACWIVWIECLASVAVYGAAERVRVEIKDSLMLAGLACAAGHSYQLTGAASGIVGSELTGDIDELLNAPFRSFSNGKPAVQRVAARENDNRQREELCEVHEDGDLFVRSAGVLFNHDEPSRSRVIKAAFGLVPVLRSAESGFHHIWHDESHTGEVAAPCLPWASGEKVWRLSDANERVPWKNPVDHFFGGIRIAVEAKGRRGD